MGELDEVNERSEKSRNWLLKDQERRLNKIDELFNEYSKLNTTIGNIKIMVAELVRDEEAVDNEMTNLRYRITAQEHKVREINKMLRDKNDPSRKSPKEQP